MAAKKKVTLERLRQVLGETNGSISRTIRLFQEAGYRTSKTTVIGMIKGDPDLLKEFPIGEQRDESDAPQKHHVESNRETPPSTEIAIAKNEEEIRLMKEGMAAAGMDKDEIVKFGGYAKFVRHGLVDVVNATYGVMAGQLLNVAKRTEEINADIIQNTDQIDRHILLPNGEVYKYTEDRWSPELKLKALGVYATLSDVLAKYANTMNSVALTQLKAQELLGNQGGGGPDDPGPAAKRRKHLSAGPAPVNATPAT